jgi:hypothetical protein
MMIFAHFLRLALAASLTTAGEPVGVALAQVIEHQSPIASFTPPQGCIPDAGQVTQGLATQACIERFSATHEFIIALHEYRVYNSDPKTRPSSDDAKDAVESLVAKLHKENSEVAGQSLLHFGSIRTPPQGMPSGANYCVTLWVVTSDHRVPGFANQEFRTMVYDFVCGRADLVGNSIQIVELRASERLNVAADMRLVKQRFERPIPIPFQEFDIAVRTLKLFP